MRLRFCGFVVLLFCRLSLLRDSLLLPTPFCTLLFLLGFSRLDEITLYASMNSLRTRLLALPLK